MSLTLAQGVGAASAAREVPVPVGLRLFLPDEWTDEADRCARAGVPEAAMAPRSKGEIALAELDRLLAAGIRFGTVLADAGHGASAAFRRGLDERGLFPPVAAPPAASQTDRQAAMAMGIPCNQKVYGAAVQLVPPKGRARRLMPDEEPRTAEEVLAELAWRRVTWRRGTKGALAARFAAVRIRVGDGPVWGNNRHLPLSASLTSRRGIGETDGGEAWLVGEWRASGERKYYLSNLAPDTSLRGLAAAIKARWVCEQAHQQLKQELGLGHFEGRSWTGLHRHALMTCIAFAYLQHLRLAEHRRARSGENAPPRSRTATLAEPARGATHDHRQAVRAHCPAAPMPALQAPAQNAP